MSKWFNDFKQQLNHFILWIGEYLPPLRLGMLLMFMIVTVFLFVPPTMGMVDTGQYTTILQSNGLREIPKDTDYFKYFVTQYPILQYFNSNQGQIFSSGNVPIQIALFLNKIFFSTKIFDIHFLAAVYEVFFLGGFYILLRALVHNLSLHKGYLMMALAVFILSDATYIGYFNSFYLETTSFILIIYFVGINITIYQEPDERKVFLYYIAVVVVTMAFMLVNRMSALIAVGLVITLAAGLLMIYNKQFRLSTSFIVLAILPIGLWIHAAHPDIFADKQLFESETTGAMVAAKNPETAATKLDIEPQYAILRNQKYEAQYALANTQSSEIQKGMLSHLSALKMGWYYFRHPADLWKMLGLALQNQNQTRESGLAFEKGSQSGSWQQLIFQGASTIKGAFLPKKFGFYVLLSVVVIAVYAVSAYRGFILGARRYIARFISKIGLILSMFLSFFSPIVFAGAGNMNRTLLIASAIMDMLVIVVLSDFLRNDIWIEREQIVMAGLEDKYAQKEAN